MKRERACFQSVVRKAIIRQSKDCYRSATLANCSRQKGIDIQRDREGRFISLSFRLRYSERGIQRSFRKNVSAITCTSYGTFLLCLLVISEHVLKRLKRPKCSPTATIWLQLFRPNENCSQESVESTSGALIYNCYSATYVELCKRDRREEVCAKTPVSGYNRQRSWLHFFFEDHGCSQKQSCV